MLFWRCNTLKHDSRFYYISTKTLLSQAKGKPTTGPDCDLILLTRYCQLSILASQPASWLYLHYKAKSQQIKVGVQIACNRRLSADSFILGGLDYVCEVFCLRIYNITLFWECRQNDPQPGLCFIRDNAGQSVCDLFFPKDALLYWSLRLRMVRLSPLCVALKRNTSLMEYS